VQIAGVKSGVVVPSPVTVNNVSFVGLIQSLRSVEPPMALTDAEYTQIENTPGTAFSDTLQQLHPHHLLAQISDFTQLAALSHTHCRPVNGLEIHHMTAYDETSGQQIPLTGNRLEELWGRVLAFQKIFRILSNNICALANIH